MDRREIANIERRLNLSRIGCMHSWKWRSKTKLKTGERISLIICRRSRTPMMSEPHIFVTTWKDVILPVSKRLMKRDT